jgi:quinolinate synthase
MFDLYKNENNASHLPAISENELSEEEVILEINKLKVELGSKVKILGHHYQQDDVIQFADVTGDSLELAKKAAQLTEPEYIIFCGVHFMAETADMLTSEKQKVILPDLKAGCSMADMAIKSDIDRAWNFLQQSTSKKIIPITYINCAATLKAFVGENNGSICTSSNAEQIIQWAFTKGEKLLFFPDQHLGRNTCFKLGISLEEMVVYDPRKQNGGLTAEQVEKAKVILWYGYCSVHQGFKIEQVHYLRKNDPDRLIIVHPECSFDVTQAADLKGSTSYIIETIKKAKPGTKFAVGTEINLVNRLAHQYSHLDIISLSPYQCLCTTMYRVRPRWLLESLRSIKRNQPVNVIKVDDDIKNKSLIALEQMLRVLS